MRQVERRPSRENHSLAVYTAIIGQRPAVEPADPANRSPPGHGYAARLLHVPTWGDVQRILHDPRLSPKVRGRLEPLLSRAHRCWRQARDRLLQLHHKKEHPRPNGKSAASATGCAISSHVNTT